MARKIHPNSLGNLTHEGRPPAFNEAKKRRYLTVTDTGWVNTKAIAKELGCSVSELLEKIGRHELTVSGTKVED
jgi:hypothetical protein